MNTKRIVVAIILMGSLITAPAMAVNSKVKPPVADTVSL